MQNAGAEAPASRPFRWHRLRLKHAPVLLDRNGHRRPREQTLRPPKHPRSLPRASPHLGVSHRTRPQGRQERGRGAGAGAGVRRVTLSSPPLTPCDPLHLCCHLRRGLLAPVSGGWLQGSGHCTQSPCPGLGRWSVLHDRWALVAAPYPTSQPHCCDQVR